MSPRLFPLRSGGFWRCYLVTLRPYLLFVSAAAGAVGLALPAHVHWGAFGAALVSFFLAYGVGQALTDVFQQDTDSLSSPYRPLVQGRIRAAHVALVSLVGLGLCSLVFILLNPWTALPCALAVAGLLTYTPFKRRWWAGPLYNAAIVSLLPVIGTLCADAGQAEPLASRVLGAAVLSVFASYAVFVLLGYFKDVAADRATGYETLPVKYGRSPSVLVSSGLAAAALLASGHLVSHSGLASRGDQLSSGVTVGMWLAGALALMAAHGLMLSVHRDADAHRPIAWSLRGFILLHLAETAAFQPVLVGPALAFYALFELVLAIRPERSQI